MHYAGIQSFCQIESGKPLTREFSYLRTKRTFIHVEHQNYQLSLDTSVNMNSSHGGHQLALIRFK